MAQSSSHRDVVNRLIDCWNTGQLDIIDRIFAANFVRHGDYIGGQGEIRSSAAYKHVIATFRTLLSDLHSEIYDVIEQGDRIAFRFHTSGKHRGRNVEFEGVNILHFESDKIAENWVYYDATGLAERLGQKKTAA